MYIYYIKISKYAAGEADLQLQPFVVVVVDDEADAAALVVGHPERHHAEQLHVLDAAVAAAGQRDLLLHAQMNTEEHERQ